MKIYLAGPMSNIKEFNYPAFHAAAAKLRAQGHEVFSPAERDIERHNGVDISKGNETGDVAQAVREHNFSRRDAIADDLAYITQVAEAIALLPGWEKGRGARLEKLAAEFCELEVIFL